MTEPSRVLELPWDLLPSAVAAPVYGVKAVRAAPATAASVGACLAAFAVFVGKAAHTREWTMGLCWAGRRPVPLPVRLRLDESLAELAERLAAAAEAAVALSAEKVTVPEVAYSALFHYGDGTGADAAPASDLCLRLAGRGPGEAPSLALAYNARLASPQRAAALCHWLEQALAAPPSGAVEKVTLGDDDDRRFILGELSTPRFNWPRNATLHELFEARADAARDAPLLVHRGRTFTYGEIEAQANGVAAGLAKAGVRDGVFVGVLLDRAPETVAALLGVLKAGGTFIPLDPAASDARLRDIVAASGATVVLTTPSGKSRVQAESVHTVSEIAGATPGRGRLPQRATPASLACVLYPPGDTGRPVGVAVEHRQMVHLAHAQREAFSLRTHDNLLLLADAAGAAVEQLSLVLGSGATLVLPDSEAALTPVGFTALIRATGVTCLVAAPALLAELCPAEMPSVTCVVAAPGCCAIALASAWLVPGRRFYTAYGRPEATLTSLSYMVESLPNAAATLPAGRPVGMTRPYVLDWGGCLVPPGVRGELFLGGAGVARGYLGEAELTRERFLPDPFAAGPEARMVRTGDVAVWGADGTLMLVPDETPGARPAADLGSRTERAIRGIWAALLNLTDGEIDVARSFFELGAESLLALELAAQIQARFGVALGVAAVYAAPTIRALAALVDAQGAAHEEPLVHADPRAALPATSAQQRLYAVQHANPTSIALNTVLVFELREETTAAAALAACRGLVERHESLRTAFFQQEEQILQRVLQAPRVDVTQLELGGRSLDLALQGFQKPFVLEEAPLLRAAVIVGGGMARFLALEVHQIAADGLSLLTLGADLASLLRQVPQTPLPVKFLDFVAWRATGEAQRRLAAARAHWLDRLRDAPQPPDLPCDFRRPLSPYQAVAVAPVLLPEGATAAVRAYARRHGVTPFTVYAAMYAVFLAAETAVDDVVFGYPTAGRPRPEFAGVVGRFANTLALRTHLDPSQGFGDFLRGITAQLAESARFGEYPLEDLYDALGVQPVAGRSPLFDAMLVLEPLSATDHGPLVLLRRQLARGLSPCDLVLVVRETASGHDLAFEYSTVLFKASTAERFARHMAELIAGALAREDAPLHDLVVLSAAERATLLDGYNGTAHALPPVTTAYDLFEQQARRCPDALAVLSGSVRWTYAEVEARADALARRLVAAGIERDKVVAILLDPCADMLPAILGVMKAGGAFLPIDPEYPPARKAFMLDDSQATVLLTRGSLGADLTGACVQLTLDLGGPEFDALAPRRAAPSAARARPVGAGDLAYVIYTSGSTGRPKGVLVEHRSLVNFVAWYVDYYGIVPGDRVSKYAGFGFDASLAEILPAACAGACLVVVPPELRLALGGLDAFFAEHDVRVAFLPTQLGEQFLRRATRHKLRWASLAGDKLRSLPAGVTGIVNAYGPTEYTVCTTAFRVAKMDDNIPIGKPIWNTRVVLLDPWGRLSPMGVRGEMCVAGAGVARGYLGQPVLTAERFVASPVVPGERMYRTGDLARWLDSGDLEFLGRVDAQVKVRGFRVELGEIEQALEACPGIRAAVVVAREGHGGPGDTVLVGFVTADGEIRERELAAALARTLPQHMVPTRIVRLAAIPLTANGKVDRRQLPAVDLVLGEALAPRTATEARVRGFYAAVLGIAAESIGVDTSFLALGGHSLKAAVLLAELYQELGLDLGLADFLLHSSVADVAAKVPEAALAPQAAVWEPAPAGRDLPLSSAQSRIFAVHQLAPRSTTYNLPCAWELTRELDLNLLENALTQLLARHPALRASFTLEDGVPVQRITPEAALAVERFAVDDANLQITLDRFVRPFDLARGPLVRAAFVRTPTRHLVALDIHHIVADGLSVLQLVAELPDLYAGRELAAESPTFPDYVWWEQGREGSARRQAERSWWLERYRDAPLPLALPYDDERPNRLSYEGDIVPVELGGAAAVRLVALARDRGITPMGVFLAAYAVVLARLGNTPDLVVGVPAAGRPRRGLERVVGNFVNTVPLRLGLTADEAFADLAERLGREALEAFERPCYQLNDLVADLAIGRDPSRSPLFDVLFAWEDEDLVTMDVDRLGLRQVPFAATTCKFDLELTVQNLRSGMRLALLYSTKLFRRSTAERFAQHLASVLEQAARAPATPVRGFGMLQAWERETLLVGFNATTLAVPGEQTLVDLFQAHAAAHPDAAFVEDDEDSHTFREADRLSANLAATLVAAGVQPADIVALSLGRSRHLLVAVLGILKAGAGYLPLEPDAPPDRAAHMLADSRPRLLLTDGATFGFDPGRTLLWRDLCYDAPPLTAGRATPTGVAYVMYTSGSTGMPKGVVVQHRQLLNFLVASIRELGVSERDVILLFSSFAVDASLAQIGLALAAGARLVVPTKDTLLDLEAFEALLCARGVTHLDTVPLFLAAFTPKGPLPLVRIVVGGDVCPVPVAARWATTCRLFNDYGPTETTITALRHEVVPADLLRTRLPIGHPIGNTRIYILDWTGNLAPLGASGELYIGGAGVAAGYLNNSELTAARFIPSAFVPGDRLYRSGDMVRWTRDGQIDFLGRADSQIKIRGFRIELGEIEAALLRHPGVAEAAVVVVGHAADRRLAAYIVLRHGSAPGDLPAFLARVLPAYMLPEAIVRMEALPVTASGKLDRRRLPAPTFDAEPGSASPVSPDEETLLDIWAEVLKLDRAHLPLTRSFFELGGHSLMIMLLVTRIHRAFGVRLSPADVFEHPTVRAQAALIKGRVPAALASIPRAAPRIGYPLSSVQRRLYAMQQANPESVSYNIPTVFAVEGRVNVERVEEVLRALVQRHAGFRTSFALHAGQPVQLVQDAASLAVGILENEDATIDDLMQRLMRPFDLAAAPLARVWLVRRSRGETLLIVDLHHIIADGYSLGILWDEVSRLMRGVPLQPLRLAYTDFACWQQGQEYQRLAADQRQFWLRQFDAPPPPVELPYDFRRPLARSYAGGVVVSRLTASELAALQVLAQGADTTLFAALLALWLVFLARLGDTDDLIVGVPAAGRVHPDVQELVGMFVNTVPLRTRMPPGGSFLGFLGATMRAAVDLLSRQEYQLEDLLSDLHLRGEAGRNPLFDVMFAFEARESSTVDCGKVKLHAQTVPPHWTKMDLVVTARETETGLDLAFAYAKELFQPATVERLAANFAHLARQVIEAPDRELATFDIVAPEERQHLLAGLSGPRHELPAVAGVHRLFEAWVVRRPEAPAVVCAELTWSYGEVDRRAEAVRMWLGRAGVGRGDLVGIVLGPCADQLPAMLGVLKAGAAFLPIDSEYPVSRQAFMLADSGARALLSRGAPDAGLAFAGPCLDLARVEPYAGPAAAAAVTTLDDAAYVIYTSGSTGKPKGVVVEHRNLLNLVLWHQDCFGVQPGDALAKYMGFGFDGSVAEVFPACTAGAALVVVPKELRLAPRELSAYFERTGVRIALLPTQLGEQFMRLTDNRSLRVLLVGGEKMHTYRATPYRVVNAFGPTEYTVITTTYPVAGPSDNIPIGRPLWNTQVLVLDRRQRLVPLGVVGELYIAGAGLARGYLNRPELTRERFLPHPFESGARLYRTGDLGRWCADGNLEFLGRLDGQVKLRGFRIELGEIEQTLLGIDGVKEAVVVAGGGGGAASHLAAYVVCSDAGVTSEKLRRQLAAQLPDYMIPAQFVQLAALPLTANGKVDRAALPAVSGAAAAPVEPPTTDLERRLVRIWAGVLGLEAGTLSVTASFFDLGGHSLKAISLVNEVYDKLKRDLRVSDVFSHPTVRSLAAFLQGQGPTAAALAVGRRSPAASYAQSSVQSRMFLLQRLSPESVTYNVPGLFRMGSDVDAAATQVALTALAARHEAFRVSFFLAGDEPRLAVADTVALPLARVQTTEAGLDAAVAALVRPFDLQAAPLARAAWVTTEAAAYLFWDMHHIVTDGASMALLTGELTRLLRRETLPELPRGLVDCVVWERQADVQAVVARQRDYWRAALGSGVPVLDLLTDTPRAAVPEPAGATLVATLGVAESVALRRLAQAHGLSLHALFLALVNVLLARLTRQDEIAVGIPVSGRWHPDLQGVVGMFVNTLVLVGRPTAKKPFLELAHELAKATVAGLDHQACPFAELVEIAKDSRLAGHTPLFDVMFVLQTTAPGGGGPALLTERPLRNDSAKFDLSFIVDDDPAGLRLALEYRTSLFLPATAQRLLRCLATLTDAVLAEPETAAGALTILAAADLRLVRDEFNRTDVAFPEEASVHGMFERAAARAPESRALVDSGLAYTYAEVESRANRLARRLLAQGVTRDTVVAVLSPPSCALVIAELAALKAGGAFLPLDHRYPRDRLAYMLRDSEAMVLLAAPGLGDDLDFAGPRLVLGEGLYSEGSDLPLGLAVRPADLAYVIYTSGSTGRPKGVAVEHHALVHLIQRTIAFYGLGPSDHVSKYAGVGFDASLIETFPALSCGAELHIVPEDLRLSLPGLERWYQASGITWAFLPTPMGEEFAQEPRRTPLKWLVVGGDRLRRAKPAPFRLVNEYGPTEFTVVATAFVVDGGRPVIPIGKPIANTKVYVFDAGGQLCPPGVPGEICLVGRGAARGYLGSPELTAQKFVKHPLAPLGGMFRTGDLGRWLADGNLEYLGRLDDQVKIRGFRIELGEVEQQILAVPGVTAAVVIDHEDGAGDRVLCGYFVAASGVDDRQVRGGIAAKLPDYMVPSVLMRVGEIPYTTSGKVDKRRLPAPAAPPDGRVLQAAATAAEAHVLGAFRQALGRADVGVTDDFFEVGGNSLKAVAVAARLAGDFAIVANDLFRLRTARRIAAGVPMRSGDLHGRLQALAAALRAGPVQDVERTPAAQADLRRYRDLCATYRTIPLTPTRLYRNILLTGATGFLGAYLLRDLLGSTAATLHLLVRAASRAAAWERLAAATAHAFGPGWLEPHRRRIVVLAGDLSQPSLGLDAGVFNATRRSIDCVVHAAALTKHFGDAAAFVAANVDATRHLLALCALAGADFNFISTTSVAAGDIPGKASVLYTELDCDVGQVSANHYVRTKLAAEKLVVEAREAGMVANIFRVGFLTADAVTGQFQANAGDSALVQKLRSFRVLGRFPEGALEHSFCPVNEVSRAIVSLYALAPLANETHHIDRCIDPAQARVIGQAGGSCVAVADAEFYAWLDDHLAEPGLAEAAASVLLHEGLLEGQPTTQAEVLSEKSETLLARVGFAWSPVSAAQVWGMADA